MRALSGNDQAGHIQRRRNDKSISWICDQTPESGNIHVGVSQQYFVRVRTFAGVVVVISQEIEGAGLGGGSTVKMAGKLFVTPSRLEASSV